jgi:hypothetical protein
VHAQPAQRTGKAGDPVSRLGHGRGRSWPAGRNSAAGCGAATGSDTRQLPGRALQPATTTRLLVSAPRLESETMKNSLSTLRTLENWQCPWW